MTPEEFEQWLLGQPWLLGYLSFLLLGSLLSLLLLALRLRRFSGFGDYPVPPWRLSGIDFGLFLVSLTLWFVLSGAVLVQVYHWIAGSTAQPGAGVMVLGGFLLQAGMLYLFLRFRHHYHSSNQGPISPRILSLPRSLGLGLFAFLASLPFIYGVGILWNGILQFLRERGFEINLPLQDAVILFQETSNPLVFTGLIILAVVVAPLVEETVFRAGIYRFLKGRSPLPVALLISGLLFGLVHGNVQSLPGLITVGICLGLTYELSGNLRVPVFFHAFFNLNSVIWILIMPETVLA